MNPEASSSARAWWGEFILKANTMGCWHLGPLVLWVQRLTGEWRIAWRAGEELMQQVAEVKLALPPEEPAEGMAVSRFSFRDTGKPMRLVPALADRPVVVKPDMPLYIPSGEEITLYVSTTLWVRIFIGHDSGPLMEIPTLRPSDTWFGPNTRSGEICYASRTFAHTRAEDIVLRPHRAITPVHIRNHAPDALAVERLSVPVPLLSLSVNERGQFWTQSVTLERRAHADNTMLQLGDMNLSGAVAIERVCGPRQVPDDRTVLRALSKFFG
ncbi:MAG: hypothetical protein WBR15_10640 [Gammaproteobacteria bacterium]